MDKNKWKDKWFYYKMISAFLILSAILTVYLFHMITKTWLRNVDYPFSFLLFQGNFLSYFTFQSNIILGIWFLIAAIFHNKKNWLIDNQNIRLAITGYLSVTCIMYLTILFPSFLFSKRVISAELIIFGIFFHVVSPTLIIVYSFCHIEPIKITARDYYSKSFLLYLIYPWLYTFFLIFRLLLYTNVTSLQSIPLEIVYPYLAFFSAETISEIFSSSILTILCVMLFFIIAHTLFIAFNLIYFFSFKTIANKKYKLENDWLTKIEFAE